MKNKIAVLIIFLVLSIWFLSTQCYGMGRLISKPSHNIILMGVVYCIHDGIVTPEQGATVVIRRIEDAARLGNDDYALPTPEITTTDENGMWITMFSTAFDDSNVVTLPGKYYGEIIPKCRSTRISIDGSFEPERNWSGLLALVQKRAGSLADLAQKMASAAYKLRFPGTITSTKLMAYYDFIHTDVECSTKSPPPGGSEVTDTSSRPEGPLTPPGDTPTTPSTPPATGNFVPPIPPEVTDTSGGPEAPPGEYSKCVKKCKPILDKLGPLRKRLTELEQSDSDNVKRIRKDLERQKNMREKMLNGSRLQRYVAPDGTEQSGHVDQEKSRKLHGYRPVLGTEHIDPAMQAPLDKLQKEIERVGANLNNALAADEKRKQPEREKIKREMDKIKLEYEKCVKSCDIYLRKEDGARLGRTMADFILHSGSKTDTSRGFQVPQPDAAHGEGPMPIGPTQPLVDPNAGFDKAPPVITDNYTTYVPPPVGEVTGPTPPIVAHGRQILTGEEVQYKKVEGDRMAVDTAIAYKPTPEGMNVTTASVATGKGSDFRKWKIDKVRMDLDGEVIKPQEEENFYIEKDSYYRGAAVATFAAIGSQYKRCADKAQSGEVCPVTGQKKESSEQKDTIHDGIDRAGMAAGMGLLASQASGGIPAKKSTFKLNEDQAKKVIAGKGTVQTTAKNEAAYQEQTVRTRLH